MSSLDYVVAIFEVLKSASECRHYLVLMRDLGAFLEGRMSMRALELSSLDLGELFGMALVLLP